MIYVLNIEEINSETIKITFNDSNRSVSVETNQNDTISHLINTVDKAIVAVKGKKKNYSEAELIYMQSQVDMMDVQNDYEMDIPVIKISPQELKSEDNSVTHIKPSQTIKELLSHVDASIDYIVDESDFEIKNFTNIELEYMESEVKRVDEHIEDEGVLKRDIVDEINSGKNHTLRINMITLQR